MKNRLGAGLAGLLLTTGMAQAGGIDRTVFGTSALFEPGNYVELSFSSVRPSVSGDYPVTLGGGNSGDMTPDYMSLGFAYKTDLTEALALGVYVNRPFGADADYPGGFYTGLGANWVSNQVAVVLKYDVTPAVSVYGGGRYIETVADIVIPPGMISGGLSTDPLFQYDAVTEKDSATAWLAGVAYQRPDIALRVALTYESGYTHDFTTRETLPIVGMDATSVTEIEMPQSVTLEFQSGIAADTLVFGSIRWSEWSVWEVRPDAYQALTGDRVTGIDNDVITYRVGLGRRINDNWSVFGRVGYEDPTGDVASRLSPTDGLTSVGLGATYTQGPISVTGGLEYVWLGDAVDASGVEFADNTAIGLGLSIGYSF